ncbi:MAG: tRNA lysidine(34) synthetase TilS [Candidatus Absconditabacterales bacterium]
MPLNLQKQLNISQITKKDLNFSEKKDIFNKLKAIIKPNENVIIAVSGGSDSVFLSCLIYKFYLFQKLDLQNLFFLHCNHGVRKESDQEMKFVKNFFQGSNFIYVKRDFKKEKITKISENLLRIRRYGEFKKILKKYKSDLIFFGHNHTDRVETTFMNLLRGCNQNGFLGMDFLQSHNLLPNTKICRPLISLNKDYIFYFCKKFQIPFISDKSNFDTKTSLRNFLRIKILPQLFKLSNKQTPTTNTFLQSMKQVYSSISQSKKEQEVDFYLEKLSPSIYRNAKFYYILNIKKENIKSDLLIKVLNELGICKNINSKFINEITNFLQNSSDGYKYFQSTYFFVSHGKIYIISAPKFFRQKYIDKKKLINNLGKIKFENQIFDIDSSKFIGSSLNFPKLGDKYKNKTWNQYCISAKIPIFWRNFIPVLTTQSKIIKVFTHKF